MFCTFELRKTKKKIRLELNGSLNQVGLLGKDPRLTAMRKYHLPPHGLGKDLEHCRPWL